MLRSFLVALATLSTFACAASGESDAETAAGAATAGGPKATVTTSTVKASRPGCVIDVQKPVIVVPDNAAATQAIKQTLDVAIGSAQTADQICAAARGVSIDIGQFFSATTNERGVLSLVVHSSDPQPHTDRFVFDLKTGKRLQLGNILTQTGIATFGAACREGSDSVEDPTSCENAKPDSKNLELDRRHLVVQLDDQNEVAVPWTQLDRNLLPSAIIDYLK